MSFKKRNISPPVLMQILGALAGLVGLYVLEAIAFIVGGGLGIPIEVCKLIVAGLWGIWSQELMLREIKLPAPADIGSFSPFFWASAVGLAVGINHVFNTIWGMVLPGELFFSMVISIAIGVATGKYAARLFRRRIEELKKAKLPQ